MQRYDVIVIGGGAAGSEVAFRVGEAGALKVALVERDTLGGECNSYGCVPSKALLKAAKVASTVRHAEAFGIRAGEASVDFPAVMKRVRGIVSHFTRYGTKPFEDIGVRVFLGPTARFTSPHDIELDDGTQLSAEKFVIATGTKAAIPPVDGLREAKPWTNEEATNLDELPGSVAIVGGCPIGVEFAQIFSRLGSRVTVIEALDRILSPEDPDASAVLAESLEADGVQIIAGASIESVRVDGSSKTIALKGGRTVVSDEILVAAGRRPSLAQLEPHKAGVTLDERGGVVVDESLRTTAGHIWCAGDVTGGLMFTHVASYEGQVVARQILTGTPEEADHSIVPRVTYSDPEVASVGLTEQQARDRGIDVVIGRVDVADNERAQIEDETRGFVKVIADARTGEVVGGHITASRAGEMIHEVVAVMAAGAPAAARAGSAMHAYPTLSESVKGALEGIGG